MDRSHNTFILFSCLSEHVWVCMWKGEPDKATITLCLTYVAGRPLPSWRTLALERIALVMAGATIVARGFITLAFAWREHLKKGLFWDLHLHEPQVNMHSIDGVIMYSYKHIPTACTDRLPGCGKTKKKKRKKDSYGSGMSFPSSHFYTRKKSQSPGLDMSLHYDRGWCCSHLCLVETSDMRVIYMQHTRPVCWHVGLTLTWGHLQQYKPHLLISQWSPSQPSPHMHWYTLTLSMQVPPFRHGLLSQSFISEIAQKK